MDGVVTLLPHERREHVRVRLKDLLEPRAIAVVGASERLNSPGERVIRYLRTHGYEGRTYPVSRRGGDIQGIESYPSLDVLPETPQLVIIAIAVENIPGVLDDAGAIGIPTAVAFAAGTTTALTATIQDACTRTGVVLLGPNCTGFVNVTAHVAASFNSALEVKPLRRGRLSVVSQSGGVGSALLNRLHDARVGLRLMVSTGDELDVGLGDLLAYLADDDETDAVLAYLESFRNAESFIAGAIALHAAGKRLIVLKAGNSPLAQSAAETHTNALATDGAIATSVLRELGATTVETLREAVDVVNLAACLNDAQAAPDVGQRVAFIGTSGGGCVLAADAAARAGLSVAEFQPTTSAALAELLPPFATVANPLDVTAGLLADPARLADVTKVVSSDPEVGLIVIIGLITSRVLVEVLSDSLQQIRADGGPPIVVAVETGSLVQDVFDAIDTAGVAVVAGLDNCMSALGALATTPQATPSAASRGTQSLSQSAWMPEGRRDLSEEDSLRILREDAGLPAIATSQITGVGDLDRPKFAYPIALKVSASDVFHKQRHSLLALDLRDADEARAAFLKLTENAREAGIEFWRIVAQPMAPRGVELMLALRKDPVFGSFVVLGIGGSLVEEIGRITLMRAAAVWSNPERLITDAGLRSSFSSEVIQTLEEVVRSFSGFVLASGERLRECEINPLIVQSDGALTIVDAKICLDE